MGVEGRGIIDISPPIRSRARTPRWLRIPVQKAMPLIAGAAAAGEDPRQDSEGARRRGEGPLRLAKLPPPLELLLDLGAHRGVACPVSEDDGGHGRAQRFDLALRVPAVNPQLP